MADAHNPGPIWGCKIGVTGEAGLPRGADAPMRNAVKTAFHALTGVWPDFTFSGWSAELTEPELAVVENRMPDPTHDQSERLRDAAPDLLEALIRLRDTDIDCSQEEDRAAWAQAHAAIARATGEAA